MDFKNKRLTLLVVSSVAAATMPLTSAAEDSVSIQMQNYHENDNRIDVQDGKLGVEHDFGANHTINAELDWDSISGASPTWDSLTGASQTESSDSVTGASPCIDEDGNYYTQCRDTRLIGNIIGDGYKDSDEFVYRNVGLEDHRDSFALLYTYRTPEKRDEINLGVSYSKEGDFINTGMSAEYLMYTDKTKNRSITMGVSFMDNEVYDYLEDEWNGFDLINAQVGITQVFDSNMVGKFNVYLMQEDGHLSNPYFNVVRRLNVTLEDTNPINLKYYLFRELRPDSREAGGISTQLVKQFNRNTQWHLSYRYYQDTWDVDSHTVESKSYHKVSKKIRLSPGLRYYKQGAASFFKSQDADDNVFDEQGYASTDHRLGNYSSWTGQFALEYLQTPTLIWNFVSGYQSQSSGLEFGWINFGARYKY